jgi:hypothetical protein
MRVETEQSAIVDGDDVYEFHGSTDTHYDVTLRGEVVAELGYFHGLILPDISRPRIPENVLTRLARMWGAHLERIGRI